ncbi:MAG: hypothetical protein ACSLE2_11850 [Lysobacterales bacterium]
MFATLKVLIALLVPLGALAAGNTLTAPDGNSRLVVENAVVMGDETTLLIWTHPELGDPGSGQPCPLNFYTITLQAGLPTARADLAARGVCGNALSKARLQDDGDVLILAADRLERWRKGVRVSSHVLSALEATRGLGSDTTSGGQWHAMTSTGDVIIAVPAGGGADAGVQVVSLASDARLRWRSVLNEPGQRFMVQNLWATGGGGALFHVGLVPADNSRITTEDHLYFISANGARAEAVRLSIDDQPDLQSLMTMAQADIQQALARVGEANPELIEKLDAAVRDEGGFDVLLQRKGGPEGRAGHFLLRFGPDGRVRTELALSDLVVHGLENWTDFDVTGQQLLLLASVMASQPGVQARRKTYSQSVISTIELDSGQIVDRLVPLDTRYLEAAMNAGDEQFQYLENLPGGTPVLATAVGGQPLAVSIGRLSGKTALRFDEGTADLLAYTEAAEGRRAELANTQAREQRKSDRVASKQQMNADLAAAVGMAPEEFAALSNRERKEAMVRSGNVDAMMAAAMKQAPAPQAMPAQPGIKQDTNGQLAAAKAPELPEKKTLKVNANLQGFIEFENPDGGLTTLLIYDRGNGEELLSKAYADGVIYEYIDFGQFDRPLETIGVSYRDSNGALLKDLTPAIDR